MVAKINRLISGFIFSIVFALSIFSAGYVRAADMVLISDTETQDYLASVVKPLFQVAGVSFNKNKLLIVNDSSLNAFVADGNYLFVHTGTLLAAKNTNELAGILAHETGHIMGGHIVRQKLKLEKMQYVMLGSVLAAGAAAVSTGRGDAAMAVILGSQSSALNSMLHYQIQEERSADESAVKLLSQTHQSTNGLLHFMQKIRQRNQMSGIVETDYFSNHPLTSERISHFREASKNNHYSEQSPLDTRFTLVQAKLSGFMEDANKVWRRYPAESQSAAAQYAHSILYFKQNKFEQALQLIDDLIKKQPQNAYFYEQKGQFLFESGRIQESIKAYEKALSLLPEAPLIQLSLAQAVIESTDKSAEISRARNLLQKTLIKQPMPIAWQLLARAEDMLGNTAASLYAAAEFSYSIGNPEVAQKQAEQAEKKTSDKALKLKISDLQERIKQDLEEDQSY